MSSDNDNEAISTEAPKYSGSLKKKKIKQGLKDASSNDPKGKQTMSSVYGGAGGDEEEKGNEEIKGGNCKAGDVYQCSMCGCRFSTKAHLKNHKDKKCSNKKKK